MSPSRDAAARDEGVQKLESMLAGTRMHAARALKELHQLMLTDLRQAEHRAERAERQLARSRERSQRIRADLKKARRRARRAEGRVRRLRALRDSRSVRSGGVRARVERVLRRTGRRGPGKV